MSTEHTPGPWEVEQGRFVVSSSNGMFVAEVQSRTDALLIASAPDLLKACRQAVKALAHASVKNEMYLKDYEDLSEAIAKATGDA